MQHTVHQLAPAAVSNIVAQTLAKGVSLSWDKVASASSYTVLYKKSDASSWRPFPGGANVKGTTLLLRDLPFNTPLMLAVVAANKSGMGIVSRLKQPVVLAGQVPENVIIQYT